jgi:dihydroorotate dehydrogenase (fumarate)
MPELKTSYMGLELRNPIIVASSDLSKTADGIKRCEEAGAGAVVLKSIFEEQFMMEGDVPEADYSMYPEALDYMRSGGLLEYAPARICKEIEEAKKVVSIPVIASINCQTSSLWPRFARQVQEAGADGLELNIYDLPIDLNHSCACHDEQYVNIIKEVKNEISIPVSVKLIPQISSLPFLCQQIVEAGGQGLVFFNWFLEPDIDIEKKTTFSRKGQANFYQSLRWVGLVAGRVEADIAASGGIRGFEGIVKQLLAGASAVQICSLFYQKGLEAITELIDGLTSWMEEKRYDAIGDFKGDLSFRKQELSFRNLGEAANYFRAQYLKVYSK